MNMTQRGQLSQDDKKRLGQARDRLNRAEYDYRITVTEMLEKSSYREVARLTGLSTNTLQRWKKESTLWPWNMRREAGQ